MTESPHDTSANAALARQVIESALLQLAALECSCVPGGAVCKPCAAVAALELLGEAEATAGLLGKGKMTDNQRYILRYTLGLYAGRRPCKNYFFSKPSDTRYWADCLALESMGYLCRKTPGPKPPDVEFNATVDGVQHAMRLVQREEIERWLETGKWPKREKA